MINVSGTIKVKSRLWWKSINNELLYFDFMGKRCDSSKKVLLGNIDLIKYCNGSGINMKKLQKCNIEKMGSTYAIESQPDVVLTMEAASDIKFKYLKKQKEY